MTSVKPYIYISDRKLDNFRGDRAIRRRLEGIAASIGLDLMVLKFEWSQDPTPQRRQDLARVVSEYLRRGGDVGTVDEPKGYFGGELLMKLDASEDVRPAVMYLVGATDRTVVALGGSLEYHVDPSIIRPRSDARLLTSESGVMEELASLADPSAPRATSWERAIWWLHQALPGTPQRFEFLAEREAFSAPQDSGIGRAALVGSPLWVARVLTS